MKIMNKDDMKKMLPFVPFDHPHVILSRPCFNPNQFNLNGSDCSMLLYTVLWNINCVKYGVLLFFVHTFDFFKIGNDTLVAVNEHINTIDIAITSKQFQ